MTSTADAVISYRWQKPYRANKQNLKRRNLALRFIEPNSRVLDIGCGPMTLKDVLPEGCTYTGTDILPHYPGVVVANLNLMQFPEGEFDVATMLGVLDFLENPLWVLRAICSHSRKLIFSYGGDYFWTKSAIRRWSAACRLNFLRANEVRYLLALAGWRVVTTERIPLVPKRQALTSYSTLYICERTEPKLPTKDGIDF
jgi:SAM-dependent methyltransferase